MLAYLVGERVSWVTLLLNEPKKKVGMSLFPSLRSCLMNRTVEVEVKGPKSEGLSIGFASIIDKI